MKTFVTTAAFVCLGLAIAATDSVYAQTKPQAKAPAKTAAGAGAAAAPATYFPPAPEWKKDTPATAGMDAAKLDQAIAYAVANESSSNKDLEQAHFVDFEREPYDALVGPTRPRAALNGIVVRHGV